MLYVGVAVVAVLLVLLVVRLRSGRTAPDQVDSFAAARSVTNRWSQDPASAPAPVRDYVEQQNRPRQDAEQADGDTAAG